MTAKGHDKNHLRPCAKFAKRMRRKAERVYASYIFLKLLSRSNVRAHHWHGMGVYTIVKSRRLGGFSSPWPWPLCRPWLPAHSHFDSGERIYTCSRISSGVGHVYTHTAGWHRNCCLSGGWTALVSVCRRCAVGGRGPPGRRPRTGGALLQNGTAHCVYIFKYGFVFMK